MVGSQCFLVAAALMLGSACSSVHHLPLVPHHVQKTRRSLLPSGPRRRSLQQQVGALYQGYGTHYVDMWVGTPPQRQTVIVDTGSGVTAFPCSGCGDCGETHHTDRYFIEAESSSFFQVPCGECKRGRCRSDDKNGVCSIGMSYQEGSSWSAYESRDMTYIGGPHDEGLAQGSDQKKRNNDLDPNHANRFAFELTFGCQTKLTGLFKTQLADGIMGMDNAATSFWVQAHEKNVIKKKNFSLCFARQPTATRQGTEAGALTMGGFDRRLHHDTNNGMVYTPMADGRSGFFSVHIRKIYLREGGGGDSAVSADPSKKIVPLAVSEATLNAGHIIVDSGTTDTYFSRRIQSAFNAAWKEFSDNAYSHTPVSLTEDELNSLPTILFQLQGDDKNTGLGDPNKVVGLTGDFDPEFPNDIILAMPPSHYMEWDEKEQKYVARFYTDEGSGSVLGANAMMGHDVNFDVENGRIGWAESNCDYTKLVNENGSEFTIPDEQVEVIKEESKEDEEEEEEEEEAEKKKPDGGKTTQDALHAPMTVAAKSCTGVSCRASVVAALVGLLLVVVLVVRRFRNRRRNRVAYHAAELEVANLSFHDDDELELDPEDFGRYRDNPESPGDNLEESEESGESDEEVADEGVGYEDESESREIA